MTFQGEKTDSSDDDIILVELDVEKGRGLQADARGDIEIQHSPETEVQQSDREDTHTNGEAIMSLMGVVQNKVGHQEEKNLPHLVKL